MILMRAGTCFLLAFQVSDVAVNPTGISFNQYNNPVHHIALS